MKPSSGSMPKDEQGMTLIELLVGLSLLSLIALMLAGGLHLGTRAWEVGAKRMTQGDRLQRNDAFLRQLLSQARIQFDDLALGSPRGFLGDPNRVAFLAPLPEQFGGGSVSSFVLDSEQNGASHSLVLHWQSLARPANKNMSSNALLIDRLDSEGLSYYGRLPGEDMPRWHDEWSGRYGLPMLIRLTLRGLAPSDVAFAVLYFAPKLAGGG